MEQYTEAFDFWNDEVLKRQSANDVVFFRSTAPGHRDCLPRTRPRAYDWTVPLNDTPFANYAEYLETETTQYEWHVHKDYNEYSKAVLPDSWYYLNIYNMTVLRRDGHVGSNDCLH